MKVDLETPRLRLHEFTRDYFASVHEYAIDEEVYRFQHWGPNSEAETRNFLDLVIAEQGKSPRTNYELAVSLKSGRHIGGARLGIQSAANKIADLGYTLRRDEWGKGYGTEVARALIEFGFRKLSLHRIWATTDPENTASRRVLEKCGMRPEGVLRENLLVRGRWRDSLLYSVLEHEHDASAAR